MDVGLLDSPKKQIISHGAVLSIKREDHNGGLLRKVTNAIFRFLKLTIDIMLLSNRTLEEPQSIYHGVRGDVIPRECSANQFNAYRDPASRMDREVKGQFSQSPAPISCLMKTLESCLGGRILFGLLLGVD